MAPEELGFTVTIRDVYDKVVKQGEVLGSMHARLDGIVAEHASHGQRLDDHELRIRNIEKLVWKASGIASFLAAAVSVGFDHFFGTG